MNRKIIKRLLTSKDASDIELGIRLLFNPNNTNKEITSYLQWDSNKKKASLYRSSYCLKRKNNIPEEILEKLDMSYIKFRNYYITANIYGLLIDTSERAKKFLFSQKFTFSIIEEI